MRKTVSIILSFIILFALTACGNFTALETKGATSSGGTINTEKLQITMPQDEKVLAVSQQEEDMAKKVLVVYFSTTGTTKTIAGNIAEILGSELYEIVPEVPYTDADLTYYTNGRADLEQSNPAARPAIAGKVENMAAFDTIVLGYPIWHGQAPRIINTFLESYDFAGKTILPFCTSHSSGLGSSDTKLHELCPDSTWKNGERFRANTSKADVETWLKTSGVTAKPAANAAISPILSRKGCNSIYSGFGYSHTRLVSPGR